MPVRFAQSKHIFGWVILVSLMFGMLAPMASVSASGPSLPPEDQQPTGPLDSTPSTGSTAPSAVNGNKSNASTPAEAKATDSSSGILNCVKSPITCAGTGVMMALTQLFSWLAGYAAALFVWVLNPANISGPTGIMNSPAVYNMWQFVRDFFNLFFILILLLSAFATVFQVENFSIRKIFLNILIAALIINFSFPITRFLIDLTNVPMYYFLNVILPGKPGGEGFASLFLATTGLGALPLGTGDAFSKATMDMVFTFLLAISLLVLGVMFTIRFIVLTLLLIFSPFGFAAALMPGFQKLGQEWWGKFWSYAFFGPAAALVLLVAIRFMEEVSVGGVWLNMKRTTTNMTAGSPEANSMATMLYYLIPVILIWTAIGMANRFSIAGASKVVGWGETFSRWSAKKAGGVAWGGAKWAGRKYEKKVVTMGDKGKYFSPTAVRTAWKSWREETGKRDKAPVERAASAVQDKMNQKWSGIHTNHTFATEQHQAGEAAKEITDVSDNSSHVMTEMNAFLHAGEKEKVQGALQVLAKQNDLNDLIMAEGKKYGAEMVKIVDKATGKVKLDGNGKEMEAVKISPENFSKVIQGILMEAGVKKDSEEMALKMMTISDIATVAGNYGAGGMAKFDNGKWRVATTKEQAGWAAAKVKNLESQKRQTTIHPDSMYEYYYDENDQKQILDLSSSGVEIAKTFTDGDVSENKRSRDDNKQGMKALYEKLQAGQAPPRFREAINANNKVQEYAKKIYDMYGAAQATNSNTVTPGSGTGAGQVGSMSSGAGGAPIAIPPTSVGGGARPRTP